MAERTTPELAYIDAKLDQVLGAAGLPVNFALRHMIARDAVVQGEGRTVRVAVVRPGVGDVSLTERLNELRQDYMYRHHFPTAKPTVSKRDLQGLSQNFEAILKGDAVVE